MCAKNRRSKCTDKLENIYVFLVSLKNVNIRAVCVPVCAMGSHISPQRHDQLFRFFFCVLHCTPRMCILQRCECELINTYIICALIDERRAHVNDCVPLSVWTNNENVRKNFMHPTIRTYIRRARRHTMYLWKYWRQVHSTELMCSLPYHLHSLLLLLLCCTGVRARASRLALAAFTHIIVVNSATQQRCVYYEFQMTECKWNVSPHR